MRSSATGMVFDRALSPRLLDLALRVATQANGSPDARRLLTVALRDHVSDQEAEGKTKKVLSRVWVDPPAECQPMIDWALKNQHLDPSHTVLHFGAMLATFPFVGVVASLAGQELHLHGHVEPPSVRAEARKYLGDRSTIDVGARKVLTTLRYLRLLVREKRNYLICPDPPSVPTYLIGWLAHSLLLTRHADSVGIMELNQVPEFATIEIPPGISPSSYPLLEIHNEASRIVAVAKPRPNDDHPSRVHLLGKQFKTEESRHVDRAAP